MATVKSPLTATDLRPILRPMRSANPFQSPYSTIQSILPDIPRSVSSAKIRPKKRVRFALTLESFEKTSSVHVPISVEIKTTKRTNDPWQDEGPLYDAYIEYLEKSPMNTIDNLQLNRLTRPRPSSPSLELESSSPTYTTTYILPKSKVSDSSVTIPLPPMHLPRIIERTASTSLSKKNLPKRTSPMRQRLQLDGFPPRPQSMRKYPNQVKREDLTPPLKFASTPRNSNEILRSKKIVDVMNNPLSNSNERSALTNMTKKSSNRTNDELFFFTSCHADHIQPIIH